jgi:hypothetical protein
LALGKAYSHLCKPKLEVDRTPYEFRIGNHLRQCPRRRSFGILQALERLHEVSFVTETPAILAYGAAVEADLPKKWGQPYWATPAFNLSATLRTTNL